MFYKFSILFLILSYPILLIGQDLIGPWQVLEKSEIPDSLFDQDRIDFAIQQQFDLFGRELRHVYYIKIDLESMTGDTLAGGSIVTTLDMPREPDSNQVFDILINSYNPPNPNDPDDHHFFFSFKGAPLYPASTGLIDVFENSFTVDISNMPRTYWGQNFPNNNQYGFFLQFISADHPLIPNSTDDAKSLKKINVFPNPTFDLLSIEFTEELIHAEHYIQLYTNTAQLLNQFSLNDNQFSIDIGNITPGQYWIIIRNKNNQIVAKRSFLKY